MILEVLLIFSLNGDRDQISDRIFQSYDECAEFVNMVAQDNVINSDYGFRFVSNDGDVFEGQCIGRSDYELKRA